MLIVRVLQQRDEEILQKKMLAVKAIEQLESLKATMEERDQLKKKLTLSEIRNKSIQSEKVNII